MKKILTAAVALTVLASASAAAAQPQSRYEGRYEQQRHDQGDRYDRRDHDERRDRDDRYDRRDERRDNRYERRADRRYDAGRYYAPRGYQARNWHRGDRLPPQYRTRAYAVDYRDYRLAPPPRGYAYHRVGNDVLLTAIATGVVASIMVGMFN